MTKAAFLDVTRLEPRMKHPTIFQHFDALQAGEGFILHNDHDPKPLYYQLLGERGDIFTWEYLQQGPEWWEVRIRKKDHTPGDDNIGAIAAGDLRKAEVFRKLGLDFCCNGHRSLKEACEDAGIPEQHVREALEHLPEEAGIRAPEYDRWELDFLADYIVQVHHRYVEEMSPLLRDLSAKVAARHAGAHPELKPMAEEVEALLEEMRAHQIKEEKILFPFIREMVRGQREGRPFPHPPFGTLESPVEMMKEDHREAAVHIKALASLSQNYQAPADGCDSYRLYYARLRAFDEDLQLHIHLENNILFPKAVAMEKSLQP